MPLKFVPITLSDGKVIELISVTSILQFFERQGLVSEKVWRQKSNEAIDLGRQTHAMIQRIINGVIISKDEWWTTDEKVRQSVRGYVRWLSATKFKPRFAELQVYSLKYGYTGMIDAGGTIKRYMTLCDWTSGLLRPELKTLQLVAYRQAYLEMHPRRRITGLRAVQLDKQTGSFTELILSEEAVCTKFNEFITMKQKIGII